MDRTVEIHDPLHCNGYKEVKVKVQEFSFFGIPQEATRVVHEPCKFCNDTEIAAAMGVILDSTTIAMDAHERAHARCATPKTVGPPFTDEWNLPSLADLGLPNVEYHRRCAPCIKSGCAPSVCQEQRCKHHKKGRK